MAVITGTTGSTASFTQTKTSGLPGTAGVSYSTSPSWTNLNYSNGTAANQCDLMYAASLTLAASTPQTLDLTALADVFGGTVNLVKVRHISIYNSSTTSGQGVTVGAAATNPWTGFLGGTTPTFTVPAGGVFKLDSPLSAGIAVSGTSKSLKLDPGANTITIEIVIAGTSA